MSAPRPGAGMAAVPDWLWRASPLAAPVVGPAPAAAIADRLLRGSLDTPTDRDA